MAFVPEMSVYPSGLAAELSLYKLCCKGGPSKVNSFTNNIAELPKGPVDLVSLTAHCNLYTRWNNLVK